MTALRDPAVLTPGRRRFAEQVSMVAQPPFAAIPTLFALCLLLPADWVMKLVLLVICLAAVTGVPLAVTIIWAKRTGARDLDVPRREDRLVPMLFSLAGYALATLAVWALSAPAALLALMAAYTVCTAVTTLITLRWKISLHTSGFMGPVFALGWAFSPWLYLFYVLLPLIAWSRLVLGKHTPAQLAAGAALGLLVVGLCFWLLA